MTARAAVLLASVGLAVTACVTSFEIPLETPIQPKIDTSAFQSVLVAGFVAGGSEDIDTNLETVRLLRSQLRTKSNMKVIEADVLPVAEVPPEPTPVNGDGSAQDGAGARAGEAVRLPPGAIKDEKDLDVYESVFANTAYWKKLGEEFQNPLIVTGTVLFTPYARSGFVQKEHETIDEYGRRTVEPVRTYMDRKGFILRPKFVFIDGRTGAVIHSEVFREEVLYNQNQDTPALSSYFELMDRLIPGFLGTLSSQKIRGTRVLLR
jgi:hypothetical protein